MIAGSRERETFRRVLRDGEAFVRFFFQENGSTFVRFVEPERVRNGGGVLVQEGWSYGIKHRMDPFEDIETPEEYCLFWPDPSAKGGTDGQGEDAGYAEFVDAKYILHLKSPDTDAGVKRGTSDFLWTRQKR